jgi:hypothetical protein
VAADKCRALTAKYADHAKSFLEIRSCVSRGSYQSASVRRGKVRVIMKLSAKPGFFGKKPIGSIGETNNLNTTTPIKDEMPRFDQCVCSLWILERGVPNLIGSGTLIKIEQVAFLITAAHIIDDALGQPLLLRNSIGLKQISGCGKLTRPTSGSRQDDRDDIAIMALEEDTTAFVETAYKPLPINFADAKDSLLPEKPYAFFGFPWSKGDFRQKGKIIEPPIYKFQAISVAETDYDSLGLSPLKHIAIEFDLKHAIDVNGRDVMAPKPAGMSGGAVWSFTPVDLDGQQMLTRRLVGIAIEYISNRRVLVGVRINAAFECIRIMFPSLSASIPTRPDLTIICNGHFNE